uniref:Uncharacterized protein n=1 Tax=Electrophorus electricus TaxID=8005 RepID=A0A4W4HME0_ELEEL
MPLQAFSFPLPETRFFQVGHHVFKFKIRRGSKKRAYPWMFKRPISDFYHQKSKQYYEVIIIFTFFSKKKCSSHEMKNQIAL